jgi:hypothetical protein
MTERTIVRLPKELLDSARRKAAAEGVTPTALIEDGLRGVLSERLHLASAKRVLPRISKATGGLLTGVDLTNPGAMQETEDAEYIERIGCFRQEPNL